MGKKTIYKGTIHGTATSYLLNNSFVIKLDKNMEGLPEEFVAYLYKWGPGARYYTTHIRPGDHLMVFGEIIIDFDKLKKLEFVRMRASHIYNETLKCGF